MQITINRNIEIPEKYNFKSSEKNNEQNDKPNKELYNDNKTEIGIQLSNKDFNDYVKTSYVMMNRNCPIGSIYINREKIPQFVVCLNEENAKYDIEYFYFLKRTIPIFDVNSIYNINRYLYPDKGFFPRIYDNKNVDYLCFIRGLNYNSTLWINDTENPLRWEEVDPYHNDIEDIKKKIIESNHCTDLNIFKDVMKGTPVGKVAVKKENTQFYVYKTAVKSCIYNEVYASLLAEILGLNNLLEIKEYGEDTNLAFIKTELMSDYNTGCMSLDDCNFARKTILKNSEYEEYFKSMCFLDALILNQDRHYSNICAFINNSTLEINGLTPIFDQDFSFSYNYFKFEGDSFEDHYNKTLRSDELFNLPRFKKMSFNEQALWCMDRDKYNKLLSLGTVKLKADKLCKDEKYVSYINYVINRRIKEVIELVKNTI